MRYGCINHFSQRGLNNKRRVFLFPSSFLLCELWVCASVLRARVRSQHVPLLPHAPRQPWHSLRWRQQSLSLLYFSYLDRGKKKYLIKMLKRKKCEYFLLLTARSESKPRVYCVLPLESLLACTFSLVTITAQTISIINPAGTFEFVSCVHLMKNVSGGHQEEAGSKVIRWTIKSINEQIVYSYITYI